MYEGKPLVLLIGGTDTGRTPMAAALLRRALGSGVVVRTAGVLSHEGETAMPEAQMALEQVGIDISRHISRPLRPEEHRPAELLLAIDRGTELVLFAEFPKDPRVTCLPALANMPDVLDPHRMPLGVWVAALRQLSDQVAAAVPEIRVRLGIADQPPLPPPARLVERRRSGGNRDPLVLGTGHKMEWDRDEDMQRLLQLINGEPQVQATPAADGTTNGVGPLAGTTREDADSELGVDGTSPEAVADEQPLWTSDLHGWNGEPDEAVSELQPLEPAPPSAPAVPLEQTSDSPDRSGHIARMVKLLETAEAMPEIVDWSRLREELIRHLRAVAGQSTGALDFTLAATLMIEGKLVQLKAQPDSNAIFMLTRSLRRLEAPVSATLLATIGGELAEW